MLQIAPADGTEQYAAARELFVEYARELGHDLCFQRFSEELEDLPGMYRPPGGCLLLATDGAEWAGCVAVRGFQGSAAICEMKRLYVRPGYRRQGLGQRLADEIIRAARAGGYQRMVLDTLAEMKLARALYVSLGFRETDAYYHNPLESVVYYELELTPTGPR